MKYITYDHHNIITEVHTYIATSLATSYHVASSGKNSITDILCNNVYINVL